MAPDRRRVAADLILSGVPAEEALVRAGFGAAFAAGFAGQAEGFLRKLGYLTAKPAPRPAKTTKTPSAPAPAAPDKEQELSS